MRFGLFDPPESIMVQLVSSKSQPWNLSMLPSTVACSAIHNITQKPACNNPSVASTHIPCSQLDIPKHWVTYRRNKRAGAYVTLLQTSFKKMTVTECCIIQQKKSIYIQSFYVTYYSIQQSKFNSM